jgi:TolB-like protein/DNA-binding winged helix-turn-helix (wHTH) protein/tetratricopeptide (TPR) repeat protein
LAHHAQRQFTIPCGEVTAQEFHFGEFTLDESRYRLQRGERRLRLEKLPMELLILLVQRHGELVSREEIADRLWRKDVFVDIDHSINTAVRKIRLVLRDDPEKPRFVETVVGKGYRFAAPITHSNGSSEVPLLAKEQPFPLQARGIAELAVPASPPKTPSVRPIMMLGVAAVAAIVSIVLLINRGSVKGTGQQPIKSLAVLPLKNLSADPKQEYLADGMTEALIGRLAGIHDLRVISRTSVVRFKDTQLSAPEIARMLSVDALVEGSVIRDGSRIRVHAQLIRAATDEHFWSETYDRELQDVLSLESDVAQSIARKVEVTVTGKEHERLTAARSVSPEVYESYLKGRFTFNNSNYRRAGIEESIRYFEEAIKEDPAFAPAYVALATAYRQLGAVYVGLPSGETRPKVMSAAQKALELDPELAEAHARLAELYQQTFRWSDAEAEYKRALELKPNDAATHRLFAYWLVAQGRSEEAVAWGRRARELDPLGFTSYGLGSILFYAHHYDEAEHELRSALAVRPDDGPVLWYLGFALMAKGQPEQAITVVEKAVSVSDRSPAVVGTLVRAYAHAGRRADALRLLEELKRRKRAGYVPAPAFVNAYLGLGDNEKAFVWLEEAYKEQSNGLQFLKVHPFYDPIREDPRFKDLVHRVGLN